MRSTLSLPLLSLVVVVLLLSVRCESHHHHFQTPTNKRSTGDALKLFTEIASNFEVKKNARNLALDKNVDAAICKVAEIMPDLAGTHDQIVALQSTLQMYLGRPLATLMEVHNSLAKVVEGLQNIKAKGGKKGSDSSSETSSSEEDYYSSEEQSVSPDETAHPVHGIPNDKVQVDSSDHSHHVPGPLDQTDMAQHSVPSSLGPVQIGEAGLSAILANSDYAAQMSTPDIATAFLTVGKQIEYEHFQRFLSLIPKIAKVNATVSTIISQVSQVKGDLTGLEQVSTALAQSVANEANTVIAHVQHILHLLRDLRLKC